MEPVSQNEFKNVLAEFDIGLFSLNKVHTTHNIPGKVLGYMVQSMPILGCVNPGNDLKEIIENAGAGFVSISGNDKEFTDCAIRLLEPGVIKQKGLNSKKLLNDYFSVFSAANIITQN